MSEVRAALEAIRVQYLASPKVKAPSGHQNDFNTIPVQFSVDQLAVMSEVLGTDRSGSSNITSSIRSVIFSQSGDFVERKHAAQSSDAVSADAPADAIETKNGLQF